MARHNERDILRNNRVVDRQPYKTTAHRSARRDRYHGRANENLTQSLA